MATPRPQSSPYAAIVLAVKAKLLLDVFEGTGHIFIGRNPSEIPAYIAERCAIVTVGGLETVSNAGAGMWAKPMRRLLTITLASRISIDAAGETEGIWTDDTLGHMYFEEKIVNALDIFNPRNLANTANLLTEPMHLLESNADYILPEGQPAKDIITTQLVFETKYLFYTTRSI